jgi:hypothetical protein
MYVFPGISGIGAETQPDREIAVVAENISREEKRG